MSLDILQKLYFIIMMVAFLGLMTSLISITDGKTKVDRGLGFVSMLAHMVSLSMLILLITN